VKRSANKVTINPTTLVHEAWLRFARADKGNVSGAVHFYNIVAQAMRQILIDLLERKQAVKRGGAMVRVELTDRLEEADKPIDELVAIQAAMDKLRLCDPDLNRVAEWHYFAGLSVIEIAGLCEVSERTVKRNLAMARAFIRNEMM